MKVIKGKYAGRTARPRQYANDWISADLDDGTPRILKPSMVQLDSDEERQMFSPERSRSVGRFWDEWRLNDDGTFTSLRPRPVRSRTR